MSGVSRASMPTSVNAQSSTTTPQQKRTITVLMASQILGALGVGASLTIGTGLITQVSGNASISGLAATTGTLGAAAAGIPLARFAMRSGRRLALATGNLISVFGALIVILGGYTSMLAFVLIGLTVMGTGQAVQLQSRFAATDLSTPKHRGRDLSLVVWSITLGAVVGPNLVAPGEQLGLALGMPVLTGAFLITGSAQLLAAVIVAVFLRPDPLLTAIQACRDAAAKLAAEREEQNVAASAAATESGTEALPESAEVQQDRADRAARVSRQASKNLTQQRAAIAVIAIAQAVMVAIMAMTPAHLSHHGYAISVIGFTISLHIAGMFALAPVFGIMADRLGTRNVVIIGIVQLLAATAFTGFGGENAVLIQIGLILLGTGWSAVTVAGSALLTASTPQAIRTKRQGQSDALMNLAGASAGALAGLAFALGGFPALSTISAVLTMGILALTLMVFSSRALERTDHADADNDDDATDADN